VRLEPLQRRALVNGGIAAAVTLVVGLGVVAAVTNDGEEASPTPTPTTSPTPPPPTCTPRFEMAQSAAPGELSSWLTGVTVLTPSEAWAVGASGAPDVPFEVLIERWDGTAWTAEEGPNPGSQINELLDVDAAEPNDVWAVGRTASGFGDQPLVLRYDGTTWFEMELPDEVTGVLNGVAAIAPDDVWVVGYTGNPTISLERSLVLHWDGQLWAVVDLGAADGNGRSGLQDVDATAADDVWAVGHLRNRPLIVRFDGVAWTRSPTEIGGRANAIEPLTPTDVWAVGAPIQRFDGEAWTQVDPIEERVELVDAAAVSPEDVWAVGTAATNREGVVQGVVARFDGSAWSAVEGPGIPGSDTLSAVDAIADGTVFAVGHRDGEAGRRTLAILGVTCPTG
jgi:hypothetical protein